jgi:hypothetical protein
MFKHSDRAIFVSLAPPERGEGFSSHTITFFENILNGVPCIE